MSRARSNLKSKIPIEVLTSIASHLGNKNLRALALTSKGMVNGGYMRKRRQQRRFKNRPTPALPRILHFPGNSQKQSNQAMKRQLATVTKDWIKLKNAQINASRFQNDPESLRVYRKLLREAQQLAFRRIGPVTRRRPPAVQTSRTRGARMVGNMHRSRVIKRFKNNLESGTMNNRLVAPYDIFSIPGRTPYSRVFNNRGRNPQNGETGRLYTIKQNNNQQRFTIEKIRNGRRYYLNTSRDQRTLLPSIVHQGKEWVLFP